MIAYLILNYNSTNDLKECISSIEKNCKDYCIVVVDNGSKEDDAILAKQICDDASAIFISSKDNLGFAKGNNLGFSYIRKNIKCDYIAMINSDTIILDSSFEAKIDEAYSKYEFAVLGPDVLPAHSNPMMDELDTLDKVKKRIQYVKRMQKILNIPFVNIAYLLCGKVFGVINAIASDKKDFIEQDVLNCQLHGCFLVFSNLYLEDSICDKTFLYGEEDILTYECRKKRYVTLYYPEIKIQHNESRATKKSVPNVIARKKFYYKHRMDSLYVLLDYFERENRK